MLFVFRGGSDPKRNNHNAAELLLPRISQFKLFRREAEEVIDSTARSLRHAVHNKQWDGALRLSLSQTRHCFGGGMAGVGFIRLQKELKMLADEPPPGVCAWPVDDCITHLQARESRTGHPGSKISPYGGPDLSPAVHILIETGCI